MRIISFKIIINKKVAWMIKKIYELAFEGVSTKKIGEYLNAEEINIPGRRKFKLTEMDYSSRYEETKDYPVWINGTIIDCLYN